MSLLGQRGHERRPVRLNSSARWLRFKLVRLGHFALQLKLLALTIAQRHRRDMAHRFQPLDAKDLETIFRAIYHFLRNF